MGVYGYGDAVGAENSLKELQALAETAGCEVLEGLAQRREKPDPKTYVGSGKAKELRDAVLASGADTVICDGELTPVSCAASRTSSR
jgi:GTP-binding protein HflX